ncbi:hypothetical protein [Plantactinospora sp. WMMB782]|uniref:hypothetical protein n=1 Tax=Plantactinospora sp. WMMB782 TaxID=3404121 RepID=UPI003B923205
MSEGAGEKKTLLCVEVTWRGNYYQPGERVAVATAWVEDAFTDRDDSPAVEIWEAHEL